MNSAVKLLELLMPPTELLDALESSNMPDKVQVWWNRCTAIRSDGISEIDGTSEDVYQQALLIVDEKMRAY